ncbi:MAG: HAD hydrolase-like protein [Kiritimatiellia bacterium]|jgi:beta-phosphoglucomutase-like phosphatase (HAD superfamily)
MSTSPSKVAKDAKNVKPCLVFELETVAFNGGQAMYEVTEAAFKAREFQLTPEIFIRFNLSHPTSRVLQHMATEMEVNLSDIEAMSEEIAEQWQQKLAQSAPNPVVSKLLGDAAGQGISLGALTTLPEESALGLIKALALKVEVALIKLPSAGCNGRPRQEFWVKLARQMQVAPAQCVALAGSAPTAQAAVMAGMHVVALPDTFNAFQDFGGADMVFEKPEALPLKEIMALTAPVSRT